MKIVTARQVAPRSWPRPRPRRPRLRRHGCCRRPLRREGASGSDGECGATLDEVTLDVAPGEFVCLLGASGCGKSTLLNLVAGLDRPSAGTVDVEGRATLMFQESALFPWLTVARNVELAAGSSSGSPARAPPRRPWRTCSTGAPRRAADKRPHELSGGMRQRVALARALAQEADVLLMDEPFGALDAMTRDVLHDEVERLWRETGLTVLFVTHNVREAVRLGDRVVLLSSRPGRSSRSSRSTSRGPGASGVAARSAELAVIRQRSPTCAYSRGGRAATAAADRARRAWRESRARRAGLARSRSRRGGRARAPCGALWPKLCWR